MWKKFNLQVRANPPGFQWTMFILFLSLLVVVNMIFEYLIPHQYDEVMRIIRYTDYFICGSFFIDVVWRFWASPEKLRFMVTIGWIDLLASIPHLRFLRLGKMFYVFIAIRDIRSAGRLFHFLFGNKISITLLFSFMIFVSSIIIAAISVLYFEKGHPGSTINTAGDAIWWALNLASTCGNTDSSPITLPGRIIGGALIIIGYGLFSMNAGILSSWFMKNLSTVEQKNIGDHAKSPTNAAQNSGE